MAFSKAAPSGFSPAAAAVLVMLPCLFLPNVQLPFASADPSSQLGRRLLQVRVSGEYLSSCSVTAYLHESGFELVWILQLV
jgi:hypothetical protein